MTDDRTPLQKDLATRLMALGVDLKDATKRRERLLEQLDAEDAYIEQTKDLITQYEHIAASEEDIFPKFVVAGPTGPTADPFGTTVHLPPAKADHSQSFTPCGCALHPRKDPTPPETQA